MTALFGSAAPNMMSLHKTNHTPPIVCAEWDPAENMAAKHRQVPD